MAESGWDGPTATGDHTEAVLAAIRLSPELHKLTPPADDSALSAVEAGLGRELPAALKRLYEFSDGMELFGGNLMFDAALGDGPQTLKLLGLSDWLRDAGWPIPQDVLMFGGNGSDELFGLWYPSEALPADPTPVVEIGAIFEPDCMAVVGTDLPAFLRSWGGYYLVLEEAPEAALEAIGLPSALRHLGPLWFERSMGVTMAPFRAWADPGLPRKNADAYIDRLDVDGVRALLAHASDS